MTEYRNLTQAEQAALERQGCVAENWDNVLVKEGFIPKYVRNVRFTGTVKLGCFGKLFTLAGGIRKRSGIYKAALHNVEVGDDTMIENIGNYIANYRIGSGCFIENVDVILTDCESTFGNGVEATVLNETGGREIPIYDCLSAQQAYVMALYRYRPEAVAAMRRMVEAYSASVRSDVGTIGDNVTIVDAGYIKNVRIGDHCEIEGALRLKNGSINCNASAPSHIGVGVIADDFIICSGSTVSDGAAISRCFIGQACHLGRTYSASDSVFFANCFGENGEACAIFAGPYTVTHHKSTLLIAGMFSFMNAGSGSNQSNHLYKLGPLHQGIMERGAKTASDSYVLWPARVGAFSLVMGRHVNHQDTSDFPFSYLIEEKGTTYIMPGANLHSVGTIRDARKWPGRDGRTDTENLLDCINFNLLSPYTIQKMLNAVDTLKRMQQLSGYTSEVYSFQSGKIRNTSLVKGLRYYGLAIDKFLGNSLISRIQKSKFEDIGSLREALRPDCPAGGGRWVDVGGMLAPKSEVFALLDDIESGAVRDVEGINARFRAMHANYYDYEWTWAYGVLGDYYGIDMASVTKEQLTELILRWRESVLTMDRMYYDDASKEFSLSSMTGFGADGDKEDKLKDFEESRGARFENNKFVLQIREHMDAKSALGDEVLSRLEKI